MLEKKIIAVIIVVTAVIIGGINVIQAKSNAGITGPAEVRAALEKQQGPEVLTKSPEKKSSPNLKNSDKKHGDPPAKAINQNKSDHGKAKGISDRITDIKWEDLSKLNYKTGEAPDYLKKLHNTRVKIVGFMVPLSDNFSSLKEFLLVPYAQACIHVPPPPPNLIIYTILDKAIPIEKVPKCALVEGVLLIEKSESGYVPASYKILADKISEF